MFKARFRATTQDFAQNGALRKNLRNIPGSFFLLQTRKNDVFKVSVVVSKKVSKRSVDRHHIKRQALAILKDIFPPISELPKQIIIFLAKPQVKNASFEEIKKDIENLVSKLSTDILP